MQTEFLGNKDLLKLHKTAFFSSRTVTGGAVMRCYDWATDVCKEDGVVIGGFQSKIERDVLRLLLKGKKPVVVVIARQMYKVLPAELQKPLVDGRLLIVSTAPKAVRVSKEAAEARNAYVAKNTDSIVFGYIANGSLLKDLYEQCSSIATLLSE